MPRKKRKTKRTTFYESLAWKKVRYAALKKHGAACQCCGAKKEDGIVLHVDHIKPKSKFPKLALELNNLQILCEKCNMGKSNLDATDWRTKRNKTIWQKEVDKNELLVYSFIETFLFGKPPSPHSKKRREEILAKRLLMYEWIKKQNFKDVKEMVTAADDYFSKLFETKV